jgi:membrane protein
VRFGRARIDPVLRTSYGRALVRLLDAGLTDRAGALTYYVILSLVPALTLILAIVGFLGKDPQTTNTILDVVKEGASENAAKTVQHGLEAALNSDFHSGSFLLVSLVGTLYVASLYVAAFGRAAEVLAGGTGRGQLKRRPLLILATLIGIVFLALALLLIVISRRIADAVADATGLGLFANDLWPVIRWGFVIAVLVAIVTALYSLNPERRRLIAWPTFGGLVACALLVAATIGFDVYVHTLAGYDETYGALGGVISFLVWAWLANIILLYGLALDQERRPPSYAAGL